MIQADVVIVGGGVIGAALACGLAELPLNIVVLEKGQSQARVEPLSLHSDPRVYAINQASQNFLNYLNIWPAVDRPGDTRVCPYEQMKVWDDQGQIQFDGGEQPLGCIVEHQWLLRQLQQSLAELPNVDVHYQTEISTIKTQHQHVMVTTQTVSLQTALLVGADGGQSKVRTLADFPVTLFQYAQQALVALVETEHNHQRTAWQRFLKTGPLAFLPMADRDQRLSAIVWSLPTQQAQQMSELSIDAFNQALSEQFRPLGRIVNSQSRYRFPLNRVQVHQYLKPRIVLVGDAAHVVHPLAGQGINLGLMDVAELVDQISQPYQLQTPSDCYHYLALRRYERRRQQANQQAQLMIDGLKRAFASQQPLWRPLRGIGLRMVDRLPPLKKPLIQQATGIHQTTPYLAQ